MLQSIYKNEWKFIHFASENFGWCLDGMSNFLYTYNFLCTKLFIHINVYTLMFLCSLKHITGTRHTTYFSTVSMLKKYY